MVFPRASILLLPVTASGKPDFILNLGYGTDGSQNRASVTVVRPAEEPLAGESSSLAAFTPSSFPAPT